jgi:hypothetical protein
MAFSRDDSGVSQHLPTLAARFVRGPQAMVKFHRLDQLAKVLFRLGKLRRVSPKDYFLAKPFDEFGA